MYQRWWYIFNENVIHLWRRSSDIKSADYADSLSLLSSYFQYSDVIKKMKKKVRFLWKWNPDCSIMIKIKNVTVSSKTGKSYVMIENTYSHFKCVFFFVP